jgi:hypothetical protein
MLLLIPAMAIADIINPIKMEGQQPIPHPSMLIVVSAISICVLIAACVAYKYREKGKQ